MSEEKALIRLEEELNLSSWWKDFYTVEEDGRIISAKMDIWKLEEKLPRTQMYSAQAIAEKFKNRVTYVPGTQTWHIWDGRVHLPCESGDQLAMKMVTLFFYAHKDALSAMKRKYETDAEALKVNSGMSEADAKTKASELLKEFSGILSKHIAFRDNLTTTKAKRDVITQMKEMMAVPADHYADDRRWFVVGNGYYDMEEVRRSRKFELKAHDPTNPVWRYFRADEQIGAPYNELQRFLDNSIADASQAMFYGKCIASALMGAPAKTKTIVDAYGETDAGKSMINMVISTLGKDFYFEAADGAITVGAKDRDRHRDSMRQARIITFLEVKAKLDKTFILKYTGGDIISTDRKYRNSLEWRAQGMIFLMSNEGMNIGAQEPAVSDRIARVNFPHQFFPDHPDERYRKDPALGSKIIEQSSGFLEWMKAMYLKHLEEDVDGQVTRSESMDMLKLELQDAGNSVSVFWDSKVNYLFPVEPQASKNQWAQFIVFYAAYKSWCRLDNYDLMEESDVRAWLKANGYSERTNSLRLQGRVEEKHALKGF